MVTPTRVPATAERPTRRRFFITGMLFVTVVINYLDRTNLAIAAPALAEYLRIELHATTGRVLISTFPI